MARLADKLAALTTMSQAELREEWPKVKGGSRPSILASSSVSSSMGTDVR